MITKILKTHLNEKQKYILSYLSLEDNKLKTMTRAVKEISYLLECSESAVWKNMRLMKSLGLVHCDLGKQVKLTDTGKFVLEQVVDYDW